MSNSGQTTMLKNSHHQEHFGGNELNPSDFDMPPNQQLASANEMLDSEEEELKETIEENKLYE